MKARRAFRIGGWVALVAGAVAAATAVTAAVIGVLALTGKATYPVDVGVGPFFFRSTVSTPVVLYGDVCQTGNVFDDPQNYPDPFCFRTFVHDESSGSGNDGFHRQDADVRPTRAAFSGEVELETTGGWSPLAAANTGTTVIGLAVLSAIFLLLWRLLAAAGRGEPFSNRTVRYLRGIGWLVIAFSVLEPALDQFSSLAQHNYSATTIGPGPFLEFTGSSYPGGLDWGQLALGGLILLVAEVFRHGATIETERRLTV